MRSSKTKKLAKQKADKYFSLYIRHRDTNDNGYGQCITCGKFVSVNQADCGHFALRDKESTRYDERNCNIQCHHCNRFRSGLQYEHGKKIDEKYGEGTADQIIQKSKIPSYRKKWHYEEIAKEYKQKLESVK